MTKITKNLENLHYLKICVLECISKDCNEMYHDQVRFESVANIYHYDIHVGIVRYKVSVDTLIEAFNGSNDYPPDGGEYDFILESCEVEMFYDTDNNEYKHRTKAINQLLTEHFNDVLS